MAPRSSWKGYLKLSLVTCPVKLYPATSSNERIRFNQLHKDTHNRINMKPVDPELGIVERSDLVKGYEYEDKQYIIIDDTDLDAVRIESNHTMNIEAFVDEQWSTSSTGMRPIIWRRTARWPRRLSRCCAKRCANPASWRLPAWCCPAASAW